MEILCFFREVFKVWNKTKNTIYNKIILFYIINYFIYIINKVYNKIIEWEKGGKKKGRGKAARKWGRHLKRKDPLPAIRSTIRNATERNISDPFIAGFQMWWPTVNAKSKINVRDDNCPLQVFTKVLLILAAIYFRVRVRVPPEGELLQKFEFNLFSQFWTLRTENICPIPHWYFPICLCKKYSAQ